MSSAPSTKRLITPGTADALICRDSLVPMCRCMDDDDHDRQSALSSLPDGFDALATKTCP